MGSSGEFAQLGAFLREARIRRGLTLEDLATRAGVSKTHLQAIEKGGNVSLLVLKKIAPELRVNSIPFLDGVPIVVSESDKDAAFGLVRAAASRILGDACLILANSFSGRETPPLAADERSEHPELLAGLTPDVFAPVFGRYSPEQQAEFVERLFELSRHVHVADPVPVDRSGDKRGVPRSRTSSKSSTKVRR